MVEQLNELLETYEEGGIDRRQLLSALLLVAGGGSAAAQPAPAPLRATILNHVTVGVSDFDRSRAFYLKLTGGTIQKEVPNQVDIRTGDSFVTVIKGNQPPGIMHFCLGLDRFAGDAAMATLNRDFSGAQPRLVTNELKQQQIILRDPDGTVVELSDPKYRL
jgi:catechol 2,3-dioxygenase-like lactoylglutathione lyase family enzyme